MSLHLLGAEPVLINAPSLESVRAGRATIKRGMRGDPVSYVQRGLKLYDVVEDGVFTSDVERAVKRLQEDYGLKPVDGIVGRKTIAVIDNPNAHRPVEDAPEPEKKSTPVVTYTPPPSPPVTTPSEPMAAPPPVIPAKRSSATTWIAVGLVAAGGVGLAYGLAR